MENRLALFVRNLAGVRSVAVREPPIAIRERALIPAIAAARPMRSPIAEMLRDRGVLVFTGTVTGWTETPGTGTVPITINSPELAAAAAQAGGNSVTLTLDSSAARYLPPRARLRIAVQVLDEDDE